MKGLVSRHRPTPGTLIGLIALVVAVAGTAIAGPLATNSGLTKKDKRQIRKIARAEIKAAAPTLSVATAQNAANAANAAQVDGHDATCPGGTFLQGGTCFDSAVRFAATDWTGADQLCADAGGYLPSTSELQSIRDAPGVDLGPSGDGHWADARFHDGTSNMAMMVLDNGTLEPAALAGPNQARCAFRLVR